MATVPHERPLVIRLECNPFVLLVVDSGKERQEVQKVIEKEGITWRSWWDGGSTEGPIATKWNIRGWPTLYLLDGKGVIRYKGDYLRSGTFRQDKDGKPREIKFLDE